MKRLVDLLLEDVDPIPSPKPTYELDPVSKRLVATSLEHQILRTYRTKFNRSWFEVRKLLDELQELTTLTYDTSQEFWAPYLRQVDQIEIKVLAMQETLMKMKTLMAQGGVGS